MSGTLNRTEEERRAALLIKYRKLRVRRVEREGDKTVIHLSKGGRKILMMCISNQETVGVAYVRELLSLGEGEGAEELILIGGGRYTYSAKKTAEEVGVEVIPPSLPAFDVFKHRLVPKHEILSEEERKAVLEKYHAEPYQFPWIKSDDPIAIILGARPGDILKITRKSPTAGTYISYRYVVK
ncbi:DNA-directed RNA polymerase subunit H [Candidatus Bathyarchaeota archaeon]|mgnify:CR=1 FL=1|nr:MAG: DNA-directed RNA polymerase subunit H [Candidatus Bathyarchaeota archaeon]